MIWALGVALVVAVAGNVVSLYWLLRELRVSHQQARARVNELELERTTLINQVADARGVAMNDPTDPLGLSKKKHRHFSVDPQTGNTIYEDGTVEAPDGTVLVNPGDDELSPEILAKVL